MVRSDHTPNYPAHAVCTLIRKQLSPKEVYIIPAMKCEFQDDTNLFIPTEVNFIKMSDTKLCCTTSHVYDIALLHM